MLNMIWVLLQGSIHGSRLEIQKKSHDEELCHHHGSKHVDPRGKPWPKALVFVLIKFTASLCNIFIGCLQLSILQYIVSTLNDAPNQSIILHFFFGYMYLVLFLKILFLLPLGLLFLITLDMMVLKNLLAHAEGHRNSRHSKCVLKEAVNRNLPKNLKCVLSFCKTIFKLRDMLQPTKKEFNHS